jgi:hypothetical protein
MTRVVRSVEIGTLPGKLIKQLPVEYSSSRAYEIRSR